MQGISYEFIFIVTPVKLVLDLIGERWSRTTQNNWIPASAGMTLRVRSLILFRDHQFLEVPLIDSPLEAKWIIRYPYFKEVR